jgi:uncharacterized protein (TIGR03437 family)
MVDECRMFILRQVFTLQRYRFLAFFIAATACAQQRPVTCNPAVPVTPTIRMEGVTEQTGDIVITCTGGSPTVVGQFVPLSNITLTLNADVTSRILSNGASEALLLLDEPTSQSACATPIAGCAIAGTGGTNTYDGSPGHPNIFQAQQISPTTLAWYNVPIDAPGQNATHILRITNVRVNANAVAISNQLQPFSIQATLALSSQISIGLGTLTQTVANAQLALQTSLQSTTLQQCGTSPLSVYQTAPTTASVTFTEQFTNAFKQLTWAPAAGGTLANWIANGANSESGFVPMVTSGIPASTGAANTGTAFSILLQYALPSQSPLSGVKIVPSVPPTVNLLDSKSNIVGTASTVVLFPAQASIQSQIMIRVTISSLTSSTALKTLTIPITFSGTAPALPTTVFATTGFYDSPLPQIDLFALTSTSYNSIPVFGSLDTGIATPPAAPAQPIATVIDCTQTVPSLGTNGQALPIFQISGPVSPRIYNMPILSSGPPVANLQIMKDASATWLNATLDSTTTPASVILSANPATANLQTTLQIVTSAPVGSIALPVDFEYAPGPWFTRYGFANSASYVPQAIAPGEPFLIGGYNFGTLPESNLTLGANGFVTTTLGGVQVMFGTVAAPLQFAVNISGIGYVAGYVPFEIAGQATTNVQVIYNGAPSPAVTLNVIDAVPAIFSANTTGGGQGAILNQDFSLNGPANGAQPGNLIYIYGGGAGQTTPVGRTGEVTGVGAPVATLNLPVTVFIDGVQIPASEVTYAGPAPDLIEGVFQVNVRIPSSARTNANLPVVIQVGDKVTQPGVTVYVQ